MFKVILHKVGIFEDIENAQKWASQQIIDGDAIHIEIKCGECAEEDDSDIAIPEMPSC